MAKSAAFKVVSEETEDTGGGIEVTILTLEDGRILSISPETTGKAAILYASYDHYVEGDEIRIYADLETAKRYLV